MRLADMDPDRKWHDIDPDLFDKIASELFPIASVVGLSCGAELFVNPDFGRYLDRLYRDDVPVREVVTNGILLSPANINVLLGSPPTSLFVSIDGATPPTNAKIRGGADLNLIINNMRELISERNRRNMRFPMLSFSVTLQKSNLYELPGILKLASGVGAVSVGIVPLVPFAGLNMTGETIDLDSPEVSGQIRLADDIADELGIIFNTPSANAPEKRSVCPYLDNWVYIDPDGMINPCPHWNTSEPLGDMSSESFHDIWNGPAYMALRDRISRGIYTSNCAVCPEIVQSGSEILKADILSNH